MSNVFVGFHDRKSCSRILKPPGGGTSDIFGTEANRNPTPVKVKPETNGNNAVIKEEPEKINEKNETANGSENVEENQEKEVDESDNGNVDEVKEGLEKLNVVEDKQNGNGELNNTKSKSDTLGSIIHQGEQNVNVKQSGPAQKKVGQRVPPGGYSSGLW